MATETINPADIRRTRIVCSKCLGATVVKVGDEAAVAFMNPQFETCSQCRGKGTVLVLTVRDDP